jgi:hypothetical protein
MNMPGFTAEATLYKGGHCYAEEEATLASRNGANILPAFAHRILQPWTPSRFLRQSTRTVLATRHGIEHVRLLTARRPRCGLRRRHEGASDELRQVLDQPAN